MEDINSCCEILSDMPYDSISHIRIYDADQKNCRRQRNGSDYIIAIYPVVIDEKRGFCN